MFYLHGHIQHCIVLLASLVADVAMENFKIGIIRIVNLVLGIIDYIIAWLNGASGGALAKLYNLMPSSTLLENQVSSDTQHNEVFKQD